MEEIPQGCIFCGVVAGKVPSKIVYEDNISLAFLDINPRTKGMTIIVPKTHYYEPTDSPDMSSIVFQNALKVAEMIKRSIAPQRISFSIMTSREIPHFHIRIYPISEGDMPLIENQPKQITEAELDDIARRIRDARPFVEKPKAADKPKTEQQAEFEDKRSDEDINWIRRQLERD